MNFLTLPSLCTYRYQIIIYVAKNIHIFDKLNYRPLYSTRNNILEIAQHRLALTETGPRYQAINYYNRLPPAYKTLSLNSFKHKVKELLLSKAYHSVQEYLLDHDI